MEALDRGSRRTCPTTRGARSITWSSPTSPRRDLTPPKTSSRFPATVRPSSCASALERACAAGARLAEPGEFTLRAYLNGRIDLPQSRGGSRSDRRDHALSGAHRRAAGGRLGFAPPEAGEGAAAGTDRAARSRHRFRRGRHQRRARRGNSAPHRTGSDGRVARCIAASPTASWCTTDSRWPSSDGRTSARAACSTALLEQDRAIVTEIPGTTRDTGIGRPPHRRHSGEIRRYGGHSRGPGPRGRAGHRAQFQAMADADLTLVVVDASAPLEAGDLGDRRARARGKGA